MRTRRPLLAAASVVALLAVAAPRAATASPLALGMSDGAMLAQPPGGDLDRQLAGWRAEGARVVRVPVNWQTLFTGAPPSAPTDPDDPAFTWDPLDAEVRAVARAGLRPLLVVSHAPRYAEADPRWAFAAPGSWAPRVTALADFGTALATRYSGHHVPPGGDGTPLPMVRDLQSWNEPNLPAYLQPQWVRGADGRWAPWAPQHYRRMHVAFARAVHAVLPAARVATAGLAPDGEPRDGEGRMAPLRFLRAFLCLDPAGTHATGRCDGGLSLDAVSLHPLSIGDPDRPARGSLDVAVADVGKVTTTLRRAVRAGTLRRRPPLWVTELNWTTTAAGTSSRARARWVGRALHRLWLADVRIALWHFYRDRAGERTAGLRTSRGRPKPVLEGWALPVDALRTSPGAIQVWMVAGGRACIELRTPRRSWRRARCLTTTRTSPRVVTVHRRGRTAVRVIASGRRSVAVEVGA